MSWDVSVVAPGSPPPVIEQMPADWMVPLGLLAGRVLCPTAKLMRPSGRPFRDTGIECWRYRSPQHEHGQNKSSQINALPAASRKRSENSIINPEVGARSRQRVTGL